jgi:hypothetical protein
VDTSEEQRRAFGRAVRQRLEDLGRSRAWLGAEVARLELGDGARAYTASAVTMWVNGDTEPTRPKVWAIEEALGARSGSLSRLLGYLPLDARPVTSVPAAIEHDSLLDEEGRRVLSAVYRVLTGTPPTA